MVHRQLRVREEREREQLTRSVHCQGQKAADESDYLVGVIVEDKVSSSDFMDFSHFRLLYPNSVKTMQN